MSFQQMRSLPNSFSFFFCERFKDIVSICEVPEKQLLHLCFNYQKIIKLMGKLKFAFWNEVLPYRDASHLNPFGEMNHLNFTITTFFSITIIFYHYLLEKSSVL